MSIFFTIFFFSLHTNHIKEQLYIVHQILSYFFLRHHMCGIYNTSLCTNTTKESIQQITWKKSSLRASKNASSWLSRCLEVNDDIIMPLRRVRISFNFIIFTCVLHCVYSEKYRPILLWHSAGNDPNQLNCLAINSDFNSTTLFFLKVKHAVIKRENCTIIFSCQS